MGNIATPSRISAVAILPPSIQIASAVFLDSLGTDMGYLLRVGTSGLTVSRSNHPRGGNAD